MCAASGENGKVEVVKVRTFTVRSGTGIYAFGDMLNPRNNGTYGNKKLSSSIGTFLGSRLSVLIAAPVRSMLIAFLLLFSVSPASGQVLPFRQYGIDEGLPTASVNAIVQDRQGYLWFATGSGLYRFNGISFTLHPAAGPLRGASIRALSEDKTGNLWIGTRQKGVFIYDGTVFRSFAAENRPRAQRINGISTDVHGDVWIGVNDGLYRFSDGGCVRFTTDDGLPSDRIHAVFEDREENLWVGTKRGLARLVDGKFEYYGFELKLMSVSTPSEIVSEGTALVVVALVNDDLHVRIFDHRGNMAVDMSETELPPGARENLAALKHELTPFPEDGRISLIEKLRIMDMSAAIVGFRDLMTVRCIAQDLAGTVWAGTDEGLFKVEDGVLDHVPLAVEGASEHIRSIHFDGNGHLWIGTGTSLFKRDEDGTFDRYGASKGGPGNFVRSIFEDREGNLWFGTRSGASILPGEGIVSYLKNPSLSNKSITVVFARDNGDIWAAGTGAIFRITKDSVTAFGAEEGVPDAAITSMVEIQGGAMLFGVRGDENIIEYSNGRMKPFDWKGAEPVVGSVRNLFEDGAGSLWIQTNNGIYRYHDGTTTRFSDEDGLFRQDGVDILRDRYGTVWIGWGEGLSRFADGVFTKYVLPDVHADRSVECLIEDGVGGLWVGTTQGLTRFDGTGFTDVVPKEGFSDDVCRALARDGTYLYVGTTNGLNRLNLETMKVKVFTDGDGLAGPIINVGALTKDIRGSLWIGTNNGLTRLDPSKIRSNDIPPPVYISRITSRRGELRPGGRTDLAHDEGHILFDLDALSYTSPERVRYRYMMTGADDDWIETGARSVSYAFLPPGRYVFEVKACNNDGVWSEKPAIFYFSVGSPFWATWQFRGLLIAVLVAILATAYCIRTVVTRAHYKKLHAEVVERWRVEKKLRETEEKHGSMLRSLPDHISMMDRDLNIMWANDVAKRVFGDDIIGKKCYEVYHGVREPCEPCSVRAAFEDGHGHSHETQVETPDGKTLDFACTANVALYNDDGTPVSVIEISRNVTERREQEKRLHFTSFTVERASDAAFWMGEDAGFVYVNQAACRSLGYTRDELLRMTVPDVDPDLPPEVWPDHWKEVKRKKTFSIESHYRKKDGTVFPVEIAVNYINFGGKEYNCAFVRDMTERKRTEEERLSLERQVQHSQKLESLGVLAGGIAHDFNNLLTAILGNADLALHELSPHAPARGNIKEIEKTSRRAAELAKQMLAYSGKGRFVIEPIYLNELVDEMAHLLAVSVSKKAVLKYNFAENLPVFDGDATQIRQVIMNLITNASEAIGDKSGVIALSTGAMDCDGAYLKDIRINEYLPEGTYVYIEVADTGCGMDSATIDKIFDPFFTTKFTGRGLGMSAVLGIVNGHKGAINTYSEVGKGTTFKVLFPAAQPPEGKRGTVRAKPGTEDAGVLDCTGTILLVDDEETVCVVGKQMLEHMGFTVLTAADGCAALDVFRDHSDEIVCVLLDLTMPHMDGEDTFRELRRIRPSVNVILCSGYNEQDATQRFTGKGLSGFIQKPYTMDELTEKLRDTLSGGG